MTERGGIAAVFMPAGQMQQEIADGLDPQASQERGPGGSYAP